MKVKTVWDRLICFYCSSPYFGDPQGPRCCGKSPCFERQHWTQDDWDAKADLARRLSSVDPVRRSYSYDVKNQSTGDIQTFNVDVVVNDIGHLNRLALGLATPA